MKSRFDVTLNKVAMSSIAPEIIIRDIIEEPADEEIYKTKRAIYDGQRVSRTVRRSLSVRVVYVIRTRDIQRRAEVRDAIAKWARDGGVLTVNYRIVEKTTDSGYIYTEGVQLTSVQLDEPPALGSSLKWTQDLELVFTAYANPFWESVSMYGKSFEANTLHSVLPYYYYSGSQYCSSTAPKTPVWGTIDNTSGSTLTYLSVQVGSTSFVFNGLSIAAGDSVVIEYDEDGLLRIRDNDYLSLMKYRSSTSADELYFKPESNAVAILADTPVEGYLFYRERFI